LKERMGAKREGEEKEGGKSEKKDPKPEESMY
jgi:hypothetical protein